MELDKSQGSVDTNSEQETIVERRASPRKSAGSWAAQLESAVGVFACTILNFSEGGAMLQVAAPLDPDAAVKLVLKDLGILGAKVVWRQPHKKKMGIRFTDAPEMIAQIFNGALPL